MRSTAPKAILSWSVLVVILILILLTFSEP